MMGFCCAVILLLWIMQILLLDRFYYHTARSELRASAERILKADTDEIAARAEDIAAKHQYAILVFRIDHQSNAHELYRTTTLGSVLAVASKDQLNEIYADAADRGSYAYRHFDIDRLGALYEIGAPSFSIFEGGSERDLLSERLVCATVRTGAGGDRLFLLLDTPLYPVSSTVSALKIQLIFISVVLLILSCAIAMALSSRLSSPLRKLSKSAKELAKGNYEADFKAEGFQEVAELSEALTYASDELAKVDRLQRELIANISHDLRTPLTMIIGYGEVMRDIEGENTPENVQVIIDEATRLSSLVSDLLEISSYQSGTETIAREPFDLAETVKGISERYQRLREQNGYHILFEGDESALVFADKKRILQVVCNLANNAINYAGEDKTVIIRAEKTADGAVRVSVTDHGCGIEREELPYIWDRYYKVDKTHTRGVAGSGLGLSIVRRILELHGARYGVDSRVSEGSCFWFELPEYTPLSPLSPTQEKHS